MEDSLGDRMKSYENEHRNYFPKKSYVIVRVDGKSFSSFTKKFKKPFDDNLIWMMDETAIYLCENMQNAVFGYVQSDEISILMTDIGKTKDANKEKGLDGKGETENWFGNNINKIVSVSAGMASSKFTLEYICQTGNLFNIIGRVEPIVFDSRAFYLNESNTEFSPASEVDNYFYWRYLDCKRNAVQAVGQANFSPKELHKVNCEGIVNMLLDKGIVFDEAYEDLLKYGRFVVKKPEGRGFKIVPSPDLKNNREFVRDRIPV